MKNLDWMKIAEGGLIGISPETYERIQQSRNAAEENKRRQRRDDQDSELRGLQIGRERRVDNAINTLTERSTVGMRNAPAIAAQDADFDAADKASAAGMPLPEYKPETWQAQLFNKASDRDILDARRGLAAAAGNDAGLQQVARDERGLNVQDRFRSSRERALSDPTYATELAGRLNLDGQMPLTVNMPTDPKTGRPTGVATIHLVKSDSQVRPIQIAGRQMDQLLMASALIEEGSPEEVQQGLTMLAGIDNELADRVAKANNLNFQLAGAHNDAYRTETGITQGAERLRMDRDRAGAERRGQAMVAVDERTGAQVLIYPDQLPMKDGQAVLPPGLRLAPRERAPNPLSPLDRMRMINEMIGTPTGRSVNGRQEMHTRATAEQYVAQLAGDAPSAGAALPPELVSAMTSDLRTPRARPSAPAPQGPAARVANPAPSDTYNTLRGLVERPRPDPNYNPYTMQPTAPRFGQPGYVPPR